jgi:hypothetical protein
MVAPNSTNSNKNLGQVEATRLLWKEKWIWDFNCLGFWFSMKNDETKARQRGWRSMAITDWWAGPGSIPAMDIPTMDIVNLFAFYICEVINKLQS